jgi:protein disulfide-isomerase
MKKIIVAILAGGLWLQTQAADLTWGTDLAAAQAQAKAEKKLVLLDFTGSDWCVWCKKFDKEALSTDKFADYAKTHLALVQVDFPNNKPQSDALKAANKELAKKYSVDGYPTFVVLDADGKEIGRQVGYAEGGSDAFIKEIEGFKNKF